MMVLYCCGFSPPLSSNLFQVNTSSFWTALVLGNVVKKRKGPSSKGLSPHHLPEAPPVLHPESSSFPPLRAGQRDFHVQGQMQQMRDGGGGVEIVPACHFVGAMVMKWLRSKDQYLSLIISDPESSSQSTGEHRRLSLSGSSHFLHHAAAPHHTHSSFHSTPRRPLRMLPITGVLLGPLLLDIHREAIPQLDHRPHQRWPLPHPQCLVTSFQTSDALHPWLTCSCHASQHW